MRRLKPGACFPARLRGGRAGSLQIVEQFLSQSMGFLGSFTRSIKFYSWGRGLGTTAERCSLTRAHRSSSLHKSSWTAVPLREAGECGKRHSERGRRGPHIVTVITVGETPGRTFVFPFNDSNGLPKRKGSLLKKIKTVFCPCLLLILPLADLLCNSYSSVSSPTT